MPSKKANPTSPGRRFVVQISKAGLHKGKPYSNLLAPKPKKGGRNNRGRIKAQPLAPQDRLPTWPQDQYQRPGECRNLWPVSIWCQRRH